MGIKHRSEGGQGQSRRRGELLQSARAARGAATPRKRNCATWNWKRAEEENSVFVGLKHATGECNRRWNAGMGWDLESVLIRLPALSRDVGKHRQRSVGSIIRAGQDRTDRQLGAIEVAASQRTAIAVAGFDFDGVDDGEAGASVSLADALLSRAE